MNNYITHCHTCTVDTADLELQPQPTGFQKASLASEKNNDIDMSENVAYGQGMGLGSLSENAATDQLMIGTSGDSDASVRMVVTDHSTYDNFVLREGVGRSVLSPSDSVQAVAQRAVCASDDDDDATVRMVVNDHSTYDNLVLQTSSL